MGGCAPPRRKRQRGREVESRRSGIGACGVSSPPAPSQCREPLARRCSFSSGRDRLRRSQVVGDHNFISDQAVSVDGKAGFALGRPVILRRGIVRRSGIRHRSCGLRGRGFHRGRFSPTLDSLGSTPDQRFAFRSRVAATVAGIDDVPVVGIIYVPAGDDDGLRPSRSVPEIPA